VQLTAALATVTLLAACSGSDHTGSASAGSSAGNSNSAGSGATGAATEGTAAASGSAPASAAAKPGAGTSVAAEGATGSTTTQCKFAATTAVSSAFGSTISAVSSSTSGIGNPICQFALVKSNAGPGGTVFMSLSANEGRPTFDQVHEQTTEAQAVSGVGDAAYFVPSSMTLYLVKGKAVLVAQAQLAAPGASAPSSAAVLPDLVSLGKAVAATL
jgi:hypothetical protein